MMNSIKFWGGGEQWFSQVGSGLRNRGYSVTVAGRRDGVFIERLGQDGLHTLPLACNSDYNPVDIRRLRGWLRSHAPGVVFCNLSRDVRLAGLAALGMPHVSIIWVMGSILIRDRWRDRFWARRRVSRIVVPSSALKDELLALRFIDQARVTVIPIGIDLGQWTCDPVAERQGARNGPVVAAFGRLEARKGHKYLLEAWDSIHGQFPLAQLWIVGTGSEQDALRVRASELRLGDTVRFLGFQSDVRSLLRKADLVVQPSLYEPFGIILLEAMACAKPIVCTTAGGMPEVVAEDCAILVPPGDSASLATAIQALLSDAERRDRLGRAGRARVETQFDLPRMMDQIESIIEGQTTPSPGMRG